MSGGVDSSVAASLLLRDGYEVVGCFMRLGSPGESLEGMLSYEDTAAGSVCETGGAGGSSGLESRGTRKTPVPEGRATSIRIGKQGCCSINDAADARLVAAELGIPFYVCNFKKDFGRIIDYFVKEYVDGRTPNPCVRCNDWLKFGKLHEYARQIGADFVASGHYARVERVGNEHHLLRGVDHDKDQSYVLFGVQREQLSHMMLPIGGMEKPAVREIAKQRGLPVFDKPDSQEICFVPDNDYAGLVERRAPDSAKRGAIVDTAGKVVGEHQGQHQFTIGQRRGLNLALGYRIYVVGKDVATNTVVVGGEDDLKSSVVEVGEANWLVGDDELREPRRVMAKFRYNTPAAGATVERILDSIATESVRGKSTPSGRTGRFIVRFDNSQIAVATGQAMVLYENDRVLGGGWIQHVQ